jgi:hypothetical protein
MATIKQGSVCLHKDYEDVVFLVLTIYDDFVRVMFHETEYEHGYFHLEANADIDKLIYIGEI